VSGRPPELTSDKSLRHGPTAQVQLLDQQPPPPAIDSHLEPDGQSRDHAPDPNLPLIARSRLSGSGRSSTPFGTDSVIGAERIHHDPSRSTAPTAFSFTTKVSGSRRIEGSLTLPTTSNSVAQRRGTPVGRSAMWPIFTRPARPRARDNLMRRRRIERAHDNRRHRQYRNRRCSGCGLCHLTQREELPIERRQRMFSRA